MEPKAEGRRVAVVPPERDTVEFLAGLLLGSLVGLAMGLLGRRVER